MSTVCAIYSFIGLIFCFWVTILLSKQPFFILGIEDVEEAKHNAVGAMGLFAVTLLYSVYKIYNPSEEKDEIEAEGMEGYQLNTGTSDYAQYGSR